MEKNKNENYLSDIFISDSEDVYESTLPISDDKVDTENKENKSNGILRVIEGPVAEWSKPNRNHRVYSEKLWDNVLASPYVQEQLAYHTLYGECNHPEDRLEVDFERVSHSITNMWKVPESDKIYATINILNTPFGRILNTLYEAGGIIGYSTRAGGILNQRKGYVEVDADSYRFITIDAVPFPSVASARPNTSAVMEGKENDNESQIQLFNLPQNVHEELMDIIKESPSCNLHTIESMFRNLKGYDMSQEIALLEGINRHGKQFNISNNVVNEKTTVEEPLDNNKGETEKKEEGISEKLKTTLSLLKESSDRVKELQSSNELLKVNKESLLAENKKLKESLDSSLSKVSSLMESVEGLKTAGDSNTELLNNTIKEKQDMIYQLQDTIEDLRAENNSKSKISEAYKALEIKSNIYKSSYNELSNLKTKYKTIQENWTECSDELAKAIDESNLKDKTILSLNEAINALKSEKSEMDKDLNIYESKLFSLTRDNKQLNESLNELTNKVSALNEANKRLESDINESNNEIDRLNGQCLQYSTEIAKVNESYKALKLANNRKRESEQSLKVLKESLNRYKDSLITCVSERYSLSPVEIEEVKKRLPVGFDYSDIYNVCEEMTNSKKSNPINIISESHNIPKDNNNVVNETVSSNDIPVSIKAKDLFSAIRR